MEKDIDFLNSKTSYLLSLWHPNCNSPADRRYSHHLLPRQCLRYDWGAGDTGGVLLIQVFLGIIYHNNKNCFPIEMGPNFIFLPEFLFILVRSPCKNLKPYDNPFWGFEQRYQEINNNNKKNFR